MNQSELNKLINTYFSSVVSAGTVNKLPSSSASIDPVNAVFSLNYTIPMQAKDGLTKDQKEGKSVEELTRNSNSAAFSYLSLSASGSLTDKSYAQLFSNGTLNTGLNFQAQYSFRIGEVKDAFFLDDWQSIALQRDMLFANWRSARAALEQQYDEKQFSDYKDLLLLKKPALSKDLDKKMQALAGFKKKLAALGRAADGDKSLTDSLEALVKAVSDARDAKTKNAALLDSLQITHYHDLFFLMQNKEAALDKQLAADYDTIILKAPFLLVRMNWGAFHGNFAKTNYITFDASQPFSSQLVSNNLNGFGGGFTYNHLRADKLNKRTLYWNIDATYLRDNNLSTLSTTEVDQTKTITNPGGDSVRTISSKYNVYTDSVQVFNALKFTGNFYYIWNKLPFGVHASPSIAFQSNNYTIANFVTGVILGFKNASKDQPVVNAEFYLNLKDLFNAQKAAPGVFRRSEIGISFSLPINSIL